MYPQQGLDEISRPDIVAITNSVRQLKKMGKPQTDSETMERIEQYFEFCERTGFRPGIEGLCLTLGISRQTLNKWMAGEGCSPFKQDLIQQAKQTIFAFLEQCSVTGKINPATSIFLMKNWMAYRDTVQFEDVSIDEQRKALGNTPLPKLLPKKEND